MLEPAIDRIARTYRVRLLLQFGSTVSGATHPRSDVDLAVLVERDPLSLEQHSGLLHELQRLFPDREVDLAVLNHADPLFLKKVTEQCRLLYGAPKELRRLQLYAFRRYQDHRKYLDLERRFVAKAVTGKARARPEPFPPPPGGPSRHLLRVEGGDDPQEIAVNALDSATERREY